MPRWATFDCYGTLIDWDGGIRATLARLWPERDADALLERYHEVEPEVQHERPTLSYRGVMTEALRRVAAAEGLPLAEGDAGALGDSLPRWPAFSEVKGALAEDPEGIGWHAGFLRGRLAAEETEAAERAARASVDRAYPVVAAFLAEETEPDEDELSRKVAEANRRSEGRPR